MKTVYSYLIKSLSNKTIKLVQLESTVVIVIVIVFFSESRPTTTDANGFADPMSEL